MAGFHPEEAIDASAVESAGLSWLPPGPERVPFRAPFGDPLRVPLKECLKGTEKEHLMEPLMVLSGSPAGSRAATTDKGQKGVL